jgi:hypothetical protein
MVRHRSLVSVLWLLGYKGGGHQGNNLVANGAQGLLPFKRLFAVGCQKSIAGADIEGTETRLSVVLELVLDGKAMLSGITWDDMTISNINGEGGFCGTSLEVLRCLVTMQETSYKQVNNTFYKKKKKKKKN